MQAASKSFKDASGVSLPKTKEEAKAFPMKVLLLGCWGEGGGGMVSQRRIMLMAARECEDA